MAGPVVAAALVLPRVLDFNTSPWLGDIRDSKLLDATARERLAPLIESWAESVQIGVASVEEIDQINIFHASHLAMGRALKGLKTQPGHVLVDGKFLPKNQTEFNFPATAVIKGDQKCLSIAAASIVAKVWRDRYMVELDQQFPMYGFAKHKGYPTEFHAQALKQHGASQVHRRSFRTVKANLWIG